MHETGLIRDLCPPAEAAACEAGAARVTGATVWLGGRVRCRPSTSWSILWRKCMARLLKVRR